MPRVKAKEWLTIREAARELKVQTLQVYTLVWSGMLTAEKVDGSWRVLAGDIATRRDRLTKRRAKREAAQ